VLGAPRNPSAPLDALRWCAPQSGRAAPVRVGPGGLRGALPRCTSGFAVDIDANICYGWSPRYAAESALDIVRLYATACS
jgi:hypothetical protein